MADESSGAADQIGSIEADLSIPTEIESTKAEFPQDYVDMTGAALNVQDTSKPVKLTIGEAEKAGSYIETQYSQVVEFSMQLNNVTSTLEVPVMLTLPVPENINTERLAIFHEHDDGTTERVGFTLLYDEFGKAYASFVVTEFSDFRMVEIANDMFDAELVGTTASVTVFGSEGSSIVCAAYDLNGRMIGADVRTLHGGQQAMEFNVPAGAESIRFILLDNEHRPAMGSVEIEA